MTQRKSAREAAQQPGAEPEQQEAAQQFSHKSVLLNETVNGLAVKPDGIYADGTLGGGGHAYAVCEKLGFKGKYFGIDRDDAALEAARTRLTGFKGKVTVVKGNYRDMKSILSHYGINLVDGIILDLGVSSYQLDTPERGFSYRTDGPLDMRMDSHQIKTAADVVNSYSEGDLCRVIRDYGEERFADRIAARIVRERGEDPILSTGRLADIVKEAIPAKYRRTGGHPAKRTFQAIRIETNDELNALSGSIGEMIGMLHDGGRLCIITFHSLEDRIVKSAFRENENPCICPPEFPVCVCGRVSKGKVITRKPVIPSEEELKDNPRAQSAKLRIFERQIKPEDSSQAEGEQQR